MKTLRVVSMIWLMMAFLTAGKSGWASGPVKVAIFDTGSNMAYEEGISLIDNSLIDHNGHGTLIAGIIKEAWPDTEIYIIKVMGSDGLMVNEEALLLGMRWALSKNVRVINMSLKAKDSEKLREVIKEAYRRGVVVVAAAGNTTSDLGAMTTPGGTRLSDVAYPAKYEEVIAVGALDRHGKIYDASAKGEKVEIFCRGYKRNKAGTSVACAYAAGFAAKIISQNPHADIKEIKEIMLREYSRVEPR